MNKGFKVPGNMQALMQQAQKMQQELKRVQSQAKELICESSSGGGMVKAVVNGEFEVLSLEIKPELLEEKDVEMLQDLIVAALNEALSKARSQTQDAVKQLTGGLNIPGL